MKRFFVYMLRCRDNSLYTGYTVDLEKRLKCHNEGTASKYTRSRLPVELVYYEEMETKSQAMKREWAIKQLSPVKKKKIVSEFAADKSL